VKSLIDNTDWDLVLTGDVSEFIFWPHVFVIFSQLVAHYLKRAMQSGK